MLLLAAFLGCVIVEKNDNDDTNSPINQTGALCPYDNSVTIKSGYVVVLVCDGPTSVAPGSPSPVEEWFGGEGWLEMSNDQSQPLTWDVPPETGGLAGSEALTVCGTEGKGWELLQGSVYEQVENGDVYFPCYSTMP